MIRPHNVIFCKEIMMLASNQPLVVCPYPGGLMFDAPQGHLLTFDVHLELSSSTLGEFRTDFRFLTTDGSVSGEINDIPLRFDDLELHTQLNMHKITCAVPRAGKILLQSKPSGTQGGWKDYGSLVVRIPAPAPFPQGTSFEIPPLALG